MNGIKQFGRLTIFVAEPLLALEDFGTFPKLHSLAAVASELAESTLHPFLIIAREIHSVVQVVLGLAKSVLCTLRPHGSATNWAISVAVPDSSASPSEP